MCIQGLIFFRLAFGALCNELASQAIELNDKARAECKPHTKAGRVTKPNTLPIGNCSYLIRGFNSKGL